MPGSKDGGSVIGSKLSGTVPKQDGGSAIDNKLSNTMPKYVPTYKMPQL